MQYNTPLREIWAPVGETMHVMHTIVGGTHSTHTLIRNCVY